MSVEKGVFEFELSNSNVEDYIFGIKIALKTQAIVPNFYKCCCLAKN